MQRSQRNAEENPLRPLRNPLSDFAFRLTVDHYSIMNDVEAHFAVCSQTGRGRSTISHLTFGSFSFDRVKGRRIAIARSTAFTSFSHAHRILVFSVSLATRFEIV